MKLLGLNDTIVDCSILLGTNNPVYTYSLEHGDYINSPFLMWDRYDGELYRFCLNNKIFFDIGATLYVFAGCQSGAVDWLTVDELIGRDIDILSIAVNLSKWDFMNQRLVDVRNGTWYLPQTKNPIPVVSNCGTRMIMVSTVDQHRGSGSNRDFFAEFVS
jgi:hypothetical protein